MVSHWGLALQLRINYYAASIFGYEKEESHMPFVAPNDWQKAQEMNVSKQTNKA